MADLLLRRARTAGAVHDVRIEAGTITALAPELPALGAEVVDLDGRTLLRGLWDEHVHVTQAALAAAWLQLGDAASAEAVLALVRAAPVDGELLVGIGFQDGVWPDAPTLAGLDAASAGRQVVLLSHDIHAVWLNSAAAARFGASPGPDGLLREGPAFGVSGQVNALAQARSAEAVRAFAARASRLGVVGVVDLEMGWNRDAWLERMSAGWGGPRIETALYAPHLEHAAALGLGTGDPVEGGGGLLRVGPLKTLVDGALNTRTAYCADAYPDGGHGVLTVPPGELRVLLERARAARLLPAVHAIGDAGVAVALDAFAATGSTGRIEHAQLVAERDVARFAALGVTASVQPAHLLDDREVAEEHWPGRTARAYPFRALLDAGATLAFGSDAPVARLDPWLAIRAAVERALPGEPPWHAEQRILLPEALAASTRGRAEPRVGDPADLAVLDEPLDRLRDGDVAATLVAGRFTHHAL